MFIKGSASFRNTVAGLSLAAAMTFAASSASAVSIVGGTAGTVPGATGVNDGVMTVYGAGQSPSGFYGANIYLDAPAVITATLLGSEAGFTNAFTFDGVSFLTGGNTVGTGVWNNAGLGTIGTFQATSGLLAFAFTTTGPGAGVSNGTNPNALPFNLSTPPNFFVTLHNGFYDLWFDDGGAGTDDNHDDLMIRLSIAEQPGGPGETPIPGAAFLFLSGIGGVGLLRMKAKRAAKKAAAAA